MGETKAKITLINSGDRYLARHGKLDEAKVRSITVEAVVDIGATPLVIPESLRKQLGVGIEKSGAVTLAGDASSECTVAEEVRIEWGDRFASSHPVVLSGGNEVLLGVYPLEEMDLMVDPVRQRVVGAHGDEWVRYVR